MKTKTIFFLFSIFLITSCASTNELSPAPQSDIVGGYTNVDINDDIKKIALFAVQSQAKQEKEPLKLVEISKVSQQVVMGMNYDFELSVKKGETLFKATAIVSKALDSTYKLTKWQWISPETAK